MEDPGAEIQGVIRGLVERPTLQRQAEVLRKYFTADVVFKHLYVNTKGLEDLIALYQYAELLVNYQHVDFEKVVYDPVNNVVDVEMQVLIRPWLQLWRSTYLRFNTILDLEDVEDETTGKTLKKISGQRDYFIRSPIVQLIPIIGDIYDSDKIRFALGRGLAKFTRGVSNAYSKVLPIKWQESIFSFWDKKLAHSDKLKRDA